MCTPTSLIRRDVVRRHTRRPTNTSIQMPLAAYQHLMAEAPVLVEIERMLDKPLHETFELVYGTSTGAIIASMVALGDDIAETIHNRYFKLAPAVRRKRFPRTRMVELRRYTRKIYRKKTFDYFLINIGIVTTDLEHNRPRVFKRTVDQAHRAAASFVPGFGCTSPKRLLRLVCGASVPTSRNSTFRRRTSAISTSSTAASSPTTQRYWQSPTRLTP